MQSAIVRWVVDASVAVKWVVIEDGRDEARQLLLARDELIAPEFLVVEVANALRSKVARGQFPAEEGARAIDAVQKAVGRFVPDRSLTSDAFALALRLQHSVYDCLYLACAISHDATMITADTRLIDKLASQPERRSVRALS